MIELPHILVPTLGLCVGIVLALTGAGGAILSVPLLVFGLHLSVAQAAPIGLLAVSLSASLGAYLAFRQGILRYRAAAVMALTGVIFSPLGLWLAQRVPNRPLMMMFSLVLIYVACRNFWQSWRALKGLPEVARQTPPCLLNPSVGRLTWTLPCARALMGSGAVAGFLSGLLGVGGGFIIVPALKKYTDLPMNAVVATTLGVLALVSTGGVLAASVAGTLNWALAWPFAGASILGLLLGRVFAERLTGARLQQLFAGLCLLIALALLGKAVFQF